MSRWYDRAVEQIEKELADGDISPKEYHEQMRDLNAELEESAREAGEQAYNDTMGY